MRRGLIGTFVLGAALAVSSGCGDQQQPLPSAPEFHTITGQSSGCDFTHVNQLVTQYFSPPRMQAVRNLVSLMDGATDFSTDAKRYGFDIMATMDTVVAIDAAGSPSVGSDLVNHLILCMYDPATEAASYPATFPEDFTVPLTTSLHGAFAVKPGSSGDNTDAAPVFSRPDSPSGRFSAVAPEPTSKTWVQVLHSDTPTRVLLYGRPTGTSTYDWKSLPHNAAFDSIVVALCVNADADQTVMVNEENLGALPFVDAGFLDPVNNLCSSSLALGDGTGPVLLARRLLHMGASLFGPHALWAAALSPGGLGGSTGSLRSGFSPDAVDTVNVEFVQQPSNTVVGQPITPAVTVKAYEPDDTPVGGVKITLLAVTNNGTKVSPSGNIATTALVNVGGTIVALATFDQLSINKPGGYALQIDPNHTGVTGRSSAINILTPLSSRFNVKSK